jgi:hypothetical protein
MKRKPVVSFHRLNLIVVDGIFAVCRPGADATIPAWATAGHFFSITRTGDELSVVCRQDAVPEGVVGERGWRCLRVAGTMPFSVVGILASLTVPLAEAGISLVAVSTFDTDYLLVKEEDRTVALNALRRRGHAFRCGSQRQPQLIAIPARPSDLGLFSASCLLASTCEIDDLPVEFSCSAWRNGCQAGMLDCEGHALRRSKR